VSNSKELLKRFGPERLSKRTPDAVPAVRLLRGMDDDGFKYQGAPTALFEPQGDCRAGFQRSIHVEPNAGPG
jgi:hypothetical protein